MKEQAMTQSKSTLEVKVNGDSSHRLKTNGFSHLKKIKLKENLIYVCCVQR